MNNIITNSWYDFGNEEKPDRSINKREYNSSLRVRVIDSLTFDIYMIWV